MVVGGGNPTRGEVPGKLSINLGGVVVQIWHPGPGHTRGDTIAWVERWLEDLKQLPADYIHKP
jgi:hypothetical protein